MRPNEPLKKELQTKDMTIRGDVEPTVRKVDVEDGLPNDHPDHATIEVEEEALHVGHIAHWVRPASK